MKEPPGDTHSDGFLSFMRGKQVKNGRKTPENARKPSKMQKNQHDNSIKIIVLIWSE